MRILFLGGSFNGEQGGVERYNRSLLHQLRSLNHDVKALSVNDSSTRDVSGFNRNFKKLILAYLVNLPFCDAVILGHRNFLPLIWPAVFLFKKRILTAHGIEVWGSQPRFIRLSYRFLHQVWPVSSFTLTKLGENFGHRVQPVLIPNTLPGHFSVASEESVREKQSNPGSVRFLSVTRLSKSENYKNVDLCLDALFSWEPPSGLSWQYDLVIHGDDAARIEKMAEKNRNIRIHSQVTDDHLKTLYNQSTHFLLPSTGEGFGIVYLEAMANGLICLGANAGGVPDVIQDQENGFLCQSPVTAAEIRQALTAMVLPAERLRISLAGWKSVSRFTGEAVTGKVNQALNLLEKK